MSDAFIIAVLAYAGLRPQELLALQWHDVLGEDAKLFVARKNVDGELLPLPAEPDVDGARLPDALAPAVPVVLPPGPAVGARDDQA